MCPVLLDKTFLGIHFFIKSYPFALAVAALLTTLISMLFFKRQRLSLKKGLVLLTIMISAVLIGARGLNILINPSFYNLYPIRRFLFNAAGFSLMGGLVTASAAGALTAHILCLPKRKTADAIAPGLYLGIAAAKIGCYMNGCCFGIKSRLPWAVRFPAGSSAHKHFAALYASKQGLELLRALRAPTVHPVQIYEMIAALFAAGLAIAFIGKKLPGTAFLVSTIVFLIGRFITYFLRVQTAEISALFYPVIYIALTAVCTIFILIPKFRTFKKALKRR